MDDDLKRIIIGSGVVIAWFMMSQALGEWITENYYLIETITLLLIFGVLYEVWTSSGGAVDFLDIVVLLGDEINRTGAQVALLIGVSSLVYTSIMVRDWVEATFGALAVVQLLAFIAIISRAFVNVQTTGDPWEIADGNRDTYLVYSVGFLAIGLSYVLRSSYHPATTSHNALVIFLSTILPATYLYVVADGKDLPSLKDLVEPKV